MWIMLGLLLIIVEAVIPLPTLFIAGAMGAAAIMVGILHLFPLPPAVAVFLWLLLSWFFVWYSRRWVPKDSPRLQESVDAVVMSTIPRGEFGRVKYEGVSWKARCEDPGVEIEQNEKVYVVGREGTTLIVLPERWLLSR
jgi:membrane protein implicated in regulation of membrane protease activity